MNEFQFSTTAAEPEEAPSLIETMRVEPGHSLPLLPEHLFRLERSCRELEYSWPGIEEILDAIRACLATLDASSLWRMRLLLAPGGTLSLETSPMQPVTDVLRVVLAGPRASGAEAFLQHKTTHRPWYREASEWLSTHPDTFDVLFWNEDGEMSEGSRSNVYMLRDDGVWVTPPVKAGALPGVQRQALLDAGVVTEANISRDSFVQARAWRVSNALRGWCDARLVS